MNSATSVARAAAIAAAALALSAATAAPAPAVAPTATGVSLTPSKVEIDQPGRDASLPFAVANNDATPHTLQVMVAGLAHDLDGTPQYPAGTPAAAALRADVDTIVLAPHQSRTITLRGAIPATAPSLYAGLVLVVDAKQATSANVNVVNRLAAPILLRGPRPWRETDEIGDVTLAPTSDAFKARVEAVVRNTGDVHIRPTGTAEILRDGKLLTTVQLKGDAVLPGLARKVGVGWDVPKDLAAGPTTVHVHLTTPVPSDRTVTVAFDPTVATTAAALGATTTTAPSAGANELGAKPAGSDNAAAVRSRAGGDAGRAIAVALGIALFVLLVLLLLWAVRRKRARALDAELCAAADRLVAGGDTAQLAAEVEALRARAQKIALVGGWPAAREIAATTALLETIATRTRSIRDAVRAAGRFDAALRLAGTEAALAPRLAVGTAAAAPDEPAPRARRSRTVRS